MKKQRNGKATEIREQSILSEKQLNSEMNDQLDTCKFIRISRLVGPFCSYFSKSWLTSVTLSPQNYVFTQSIQEK